MTTVIDFEAVRHRVKLVRDSGDTTLYENRDGVDCPVCGEPFDDALTTRSRTYEVPPEVDSGLCVAREPDRLLLFNHARKGDD